MSDQENGFCERLAEMFPDVRKMLNDHLADYDELLPHVFLGDVTRYVLQGGPDRARIVQHLEDAFAREREGIDELIAVSFVENIETLECLNAALNGVTGDALRQEWERQREV